jgi:hypothetical protein
MSGAEPLPLASVPKRLVFQGTPCIDFFAYATMTYRSNNVAATSRPVAVLGVQAVLVRLSCTASPGQRPPGLGGNQKRPHILSRSKRLLIFEFDVQKQ